MKYAILAFVIAIVGCTKPDDSCRVLSQSGYKNIKTGGWNLFSCSDSDTFATGFTATSQNGSPVSGTVYQGFLKGATIRLD